MKLKCVMKVTSLNLCCILTLVVTIKVIGMSMQNPYESFMDGWMDGWVVGWMDGWINGWIDG